ncbi:hypothetical protein ACFQAT_28505 [Undibacterium arcticum]
MATVGKISKENIEQARQLLLAEIYSEKTDDRHANWKWLSSFLVH